MVDIIGGDDKDARKQTEKRIEEEAKRGKALEQILGKLRSQNTILLEQEKHDRNSRRHLLEMKSRTKIIQFF